MVLSKQYTKEVWPSKLQEEIESSEGTIIEAILLKDTDQVTINFNTDIDSTVEASVDALVSAHSNIRSKVKIHNHIVEYSYNPYLVPKEHDYIRGLETNLFPQRTFYFGELQHSVRGVRKEPKFGW